MSAGSQRTERSTRSGSRPRVISARELHSRVAGRAGRAAVRVALREVDEHERPRTRDDCRGAERPCPWVGCKYHLYLSVTPNGGIQIAFPDLEPWELEQTCALDVAEQGGITLDEVGRLTNLTRERIRQLEVRGLARLRTRRVDLGR